MSAAMAGSCEVAPEAPEPELANAWEAGDASGAGRDAVARLCPRSATARSDKAASAASLRTRSHLNASLASSQPHDGPIEPSPSDSPPSWTASALALNHRKKLAMLEILPDPTPHPRPAAVEDT